MANLDQLWILVCACFVFFMQAGFICYEVGFVQPKNAISVAMENIIAFVVATLAFYLVGYRIMFGDGTDAIFIFYELMFAGTAVTIFSGSMSERTKLSALIPATILVGALIYPVYGHWVWGSLDGGAMGFLGKLGFLDFAGASVVHGTAGWVALAGIIIVGARKGRWDANQNSMRLGRSNIPFAALGTFILWFSWFGFNGGSLLRFDAQIGLILLNTNLAACAGVVGAVIATYLIAKNQSYMEAIFNGALGGLVAITAGSDMLTPVTSILVGTISGLIVVLGSLLLQKLKIDDAVNAVPIHGFGGVCGVLLCPLFAEPEYLNYSSRLTQFGVQALGVAVNFAWVFGTSLLVFFIINKIIGLRVAPEEEVKGLNIVEFSDVYTWMQQMKEAQYENLTQDLNEQISQQNAALRRQAKMLVETQERERETIARDLHDGAGQSLAALKINLGLLSAETGDEQLDARRDISISLVDNTMEEIRNVLHNLKPIELVNEGLAASIRSLCQKTEKISGIRFMCKIEEPLPHWDPTEELNLYRIVQENLTNMVKHSKANNAEVEFVGLDKYKYQLKITDDGMGFDPQGAHGGLGLTAMKERAAMLNATIRVESHPGEGTKMTLEVPYEQD
jgi:ammonium transporter, Amt family